MKILHVTLGFYPAEGWGGPVKIVRENGRELLRRGHEVTVVCTNLFDKRRKIEPRTFHRNVDGLEVYYFNTHNLPFWPGTLGPIWVPGLGPWLRREVRRLDVIHINGYRNFMNLPVVRAAKAANVPVVMQPHGGLPVIVNSIAVKRLYDRMLGGIELDATRAFVVGQESERQQALQRGIPDSRIHIIYNGLSIDPNSPVPPPGAFRQRLGIAPDVPLILFLARINKKKGADMMVEAFARVQTPRAVLVIAGPDDGQLAEVQSLIAAHGLNNRVILPGLLQGDDVSAAFSDADLYVLPCRTDTFPQTILEACRAGTPMVISETCETAYLVKDTIGDVVPFDAGAFSQAIDSLLADGARYQRYETSCGAMMRDVFSIEKNVDQLEALYRKVIAAMR